MIGITNTRKELIFVEMFNKNVNSFTDTSKPIVIKFEDNKPESEFSYFYINAEMIMDIINANVGITYSTIKYILPHLYLLMEPENHHIQNINNMFNQKWFTKSDEDLVFLCIYPAGFDKNPIFSAQAKDLLSGCFDISVYRVTAD